MSHNQAPSNGKYKRAPQTIYVGRSACSSKQINKLVIKMSSKMQMVIRETRPSDKYQSYC